MSILHVNKKVKNTLRVVSFKLAHGRLFVRRLAGVNGWGDDLIALSINQIFHLLANFTASNHDGCLELTPYTGGATNIAAHTYYCHGNHHSDAQSATSPRRKQRLFGYKGLRAAPLLRATNALVTVRN
jgi:hypothetical protein